MMIESSAKQLVKMRLMGYCVRRSWVGHYKSRSCYLSRCQRPSDGLMIHTASLYFHDRRELEANTGPVKDFVVASMYEVKLV